MQHRATLIPCSQLAGTSANGSEPYELDDFASLRYELNDAKSMLDPIYAKYPVAWRKYQQFADPFANFKRALVNQYNTQCTTNAWLKFYEMNAHWKFIDNLQAAQPPLIFFNAELPGAAICATNHYCKTRGLAFDWVASSYVPQSTNTALGDIYGIYARNRSKWLMNERNNGDMTRVDNIYDIVSRIGGTVNLYTHDAGMSLGQAGKEDFEHQEQINMKLHLGTAIAGFATLAPRGIFVAKQYTPFETLTWNLIILYAGMFDKFYMCKPITSREYNSEIYLLGIGFRGFDAKVRALLIDKLANFSESPLFPRDSLVNFEPQINAIREFTRDAFGAQARAIRAMVAQYARGNYEAELTARNKEITREWLAKYPIKRLANSDKILARS